MIDMIVPHALAAAAEANADDPKWIGEIVVALCGGRKQALDRAQKTIVAMCHNELERRAAKRESDRIRKQNNRKGKKEAR